MIDVFHLIQFRLLRFSELAFPVFVKLFAGPVGVRLRRPERDDFLRARATAKKLDEFLALSYWKEKKLPVIVVRLFNTVGPRQTGRYGMVLPNFVKAALDGKPISVYGNGRQSRCFCDVRDTVEALARLVKERTRSSSPIEFIPYDQAYEPGFEDMMRRVPSVEKLHALTGFRPQTPLNEIIDRVTTYFQSKSEPAHQAATSAV